MIARQGEVGAFKRGHTRWARRKVAGKVYKAKVRVDEGGRKLLVRGFIKISLIGRTQTWVRED
jgi:uncharacterized protein (DUF2147 family)